MIPTSSIIWAGFIALVLLLLAIDLLLSRRTTRPASSRKSIFTCLAWVFFSFLLGGGIWSLKGHESGLQFFAGYLIEYSLSTDNLFIFVLIFGYFQVSQEQQHRILFFGILGALVLRGLMIGMGALLLAKFHWILYLFGVFLLFTGGRMLCGRHTKMAIANNPLLQFCQRHLPVSEHYHGSHFIARENGRRLLTPLFLVLIVVESIDLLFAVDSIPAIFTITQDPFIIFSSNICAILGLRSLYFLLAGAVTHLHYLKTGLAIVLTFIGGKMLLAYFVEIPTTFSLAIVAGIILVSVLASLARDPRAVTPK